MSVVTLALLQNGRHTFVLSPSSLLSPAKKAYNIKLLLSDQAGWLTRGRFRLAPTGDLAVQEQPAVLAARGTPLVKAAADLVPSLLFAPEAQDLDIVRGRPTWFIERRVARVSGDS